MDKNLNNNCMTQYYCSQGKRNCTS